MKIYAGFEHRSGDPDYEVLALLAFDKEQIKKWEGDDPDRHSEVWEIGVEGGGYDDVLAMYQRDKLIGYNHKKEGKELYIIPESDIHPTETIAHYTMGVEDWDVYEKWKQTRRKENIKK